MKYIYTFFLLSLFSVLTYSQETNPITLRVHYATRFRVFDKEDRFRQDEKILDVSKTCSRFYSLWESKIQDVKDSAISRGCTLSEVMNAIAKTGYPHSFDNYDLYKDYSARNSYITLDDEFKTIRFSDVYSNPHWEFLNSDTTIVGYKCQKAITEYCGRTWTVWYTSKIPVSLGPWLLGGLPGLILKAEAKNNDFSFTCIELEQPKSEFIRPPRKHDIECSHSEYVQLRYESAYDTQAYMKNRFNFYSGPGYTLDGKPLKKRHHYPVLYDKLTKPKKGFK